MKLSFLTTALISLAVASPALAAAEQYTLDPMHTAVTFHINHFGFSNPSGKWMNAEGTLMLDEKNPAASMLDVTIPVSGIQTGVAKLDEHLQSKDFFDVATYPTAHFVSSNVTLTGKNTAKLDGNLTLHGVTKPLTLDVKLNQIAENMFKKHTAGFSATATLKRSDFGISTYAPALGDEVTLTIEAEANRVDAPQSH